MIKKTVEDLLIEAGTISTQHVEECKQDLAKKGGSLEQCLIDKKFITAEQLAQTYAAFASYEYIPVITEKMADLTLLAKVPLQFLRANGVIPVLNNAKITIITANPLEFQPLDELTMLLGGDVEYGVSTPAVIMDAVNRYYPLEGSKEMIEDIEGEEKDISQAVALEDIEEKDILTMATEAPIIKLVNSILYQAVKRNASDIHIEPFEKEVRVRYRVDGNMYNVMTIPKRIQGALISRIKIMAHMDIAEKRVPQDNRINIKVANKPIDIRVSVLPVAYGERVVMRILDKTRSFQEINNMGLSERDKKVILASIEKPNGIIYVTGPTGSGKTTTLYSILAALNKPDVNIITVEDPVEYQLAGIGQVNVKDKVGMTFAAALRSILRQDPDVIMIGETRDQETAQIAIQAALTGHLVLSTLHTNDAPSTVTRLIDMGIEPFLIASSVELAMAQRLVRRLCDKCKKAYQPPQELIARLGITPEQAKAITFYEAVGCEECSKTGYNGRLAIYEVMEMTDAVAKFTMDRSDTSSIRKQAIQDGMSLLIQDGVRKIQEGITTIEEVLAVSTMDI